MATWSILGRPRAALFFSFSSFLRLGEVSGCRLEWDWEIDGLPRQALVERADVSGKDPDCAQKRLFAFSSTPQRTTSDDAGKRANRSKTDLAPSINIDVVG